MNDFLLDRGPYFLFAMVILVGLYIMIAHRNLVKAVIGLLMFQTGIILFFILLAVNAGGSIPILESYGKVSETGEPVVEHLMNPLPHAMMLTAIVVGVATLGMAIAILLRLQAEVGNVEEGYQEGEARP